MTSPLYAAAKAALSRRGEFLGVGVNANKILLAIARIEKREKPAQKLDLEASNQMIDAWVRGQDQAVQPVPKFERGELTISREWRFAMERTRESIVRGKSLGIDRP